jgi:hypothetical protein
MFTYSYLLNNVIARSLLHEIVKEAVKMNYEYKAKGTHLILS